MISLIFPRITGKTKIFYVKITIGTGDNTDYYPKLREFGKFRIGNDDDNDEMILYPGQFDFSFVANTKAEFDIIYNELKNNQDATEIVVRYNNDTGAIRFKGKSNHQSMDTRRIVRTFSLMFYDDYKILQEPWNIPAGPGYPDQFMTIEEMLRLSCELDFDELIITTQFSFDYDSGSGGFSFNLDELAFHKHNKFGRFIKNTPGTADQKTWYESSLKSHSLLTILNNFASYAVIGLDRKLYIVPRFYQGGAVVNINSEDTYSGSTHSTFLPKYRGMRMMNMFVDTIFSIWHFGEVFLKGNIFPHEVDNADQVKTYWIQCILNDWDQDGTTGLVTQMRRKDSGGNLFNIFINTTRYRQADGTLSYYDGLGEHLGNILFSLVSVARSKIYAKIPNTDYNHSYFFTVDGLPTKYRPIMMEYDDMLDMTDMVLVECPPISTHVPSGPY